MLPGFYNKRGQSAGAGPVRASGLDGLSIRKLAGTELVRAEKDRTAWGTWPPVAAHLSLP